jgi:hypothetical protein
MSSEEQLKKNEPFVSLLKEVQSLPKEVQENYKKALQKIEQISYFGPCWSILSAQLSFHVIEENNQFLKNDLLTFKKEGKDFAWAMENVFKQAEKVGEKLGREQTFDEVRDIVYEICREKWNNMEGFGKKMLSEFGLLATQHATRFVQLALISDQEGFNKTKPLYPLIQIYELGLVPIVKRDKIIVAFPLKDDKNQNLIGYYVEGSSSLIDGRGNIIIPSSQLVSV